MAGINAQLSKEIKFMYEKDIFAVEQNLFSKENIDFFTNEVELMLKGITKAQKNGLDKITNILITQSKVNIDNDILEYNVSCFSKGEFVNKLDFEHTFNVGHIFKNFRNIKQCIPKILHKNNSSDNFQVIKESEKYIFFYNIFLVKTLREVLKDEYILNILKQLEQDEGFSISVGEIYEMQYYIYKQKI